MAREEGTRPETRFVRSGSESADSRILEEHVVCNGPQEDGESVREQNQTLEERVTFNPSQEDARD